MADLDPTTLASVSENLPDCLRDLIRHKDFQLKNKLQKQLNKIRNSGEEKQQIKPKGRQKKLVPFNEDASDEEYKDYRHSIGESAGGTNVAIKRNKRIKTD